MQLLDYFIDCYHLDLIFYHVLIKVDTQDNLTLFHSYQKVTTATHCFSQNVVNDNMDFHLLVLDQGQAFAKLFTFLLQKQTKFDSYLVFLLLGIFQANRWDSNFLSYQKIKVVNQKVKVNHVLTTFCFIPHILRRSSSLFVPFVQNCFQKLP